MKTSFFQKITGNAVTILAITAFLFLSSLNNDDRAADTPCCSGYKIDVPHLKQFMIDSLRKIQFEGSVYSKADLISALSSLNPADDSVFIMNTLVNCDVSQGTDLALTTKRSAGVQFVKAKRPCHGCPNKPCCRTVACVARIKRNCISYTPYIPAIAGVPDTRSSYTAVADE